MLQYLSTALIFALGGLFLRLLIHNNKVWNFIASTNHLYAKAISLSIVNILGVIFLLFVLKSTTVKTSPLIISIFLGCFTTFSSYIYISVQLSEKTSTLIGLSYLLLNPLIAYALLRFLKN